MSWPSRRRTPRSGRGSTHIEDVRRLLAGLGYQIASADYTHCTARCTRGAHIFFKASRMRLATLRSDAPAAGMAGMSTIAQTDFGGIQDRAVSWAFLTPVGSNRTSLYVSTHLPTQKTAQGERLRVAVAAKLQAVGRRADPGQRPHRGEPRHRR